MKSCQKITSPAPGPRMLSFSFPGLCAQPCFPRCARGLDSGSSASSPSELLAERSARPRPLLRAMGTPRCTHAWARPGAGCGGGRAHMAAPWSPGLAPLLVPWFVLGLRGAGGPWKGLWAWRSASTWLGAPRPVPWGGGRAFPPQPSPYSPLVYPTGSPRPPTRSENLQLR